VVTIKHRSRLVSGNLHSDSFRNSGSHHISDCRPPEIVTQLTRESHRLTSLAPVLVKGLDALSTIMEDPRTFRMLDVGLPLAYQESV
jgi:hypothetical protein